jgi:ribosome biogenesis GTPase / thiamine phosphate phosphatase
VSDTQGIVVRQHLGHYFVVINDEQWDCAISSRLRKQLEYPEAASGSRRRRVQRVRRTKVTDPVVIGDLVEIDPGDDFTGMIREVLPRRNKVSRKASGSGRKEQLLAANIDRMIPVFAVTNPRPDWNLLDRMLGIAEWQELPVTICINKMDLETTPIRDITSAYEKAGYPIVYTSTETNVGKDAFREILREGTSLFVGSSGVGKSSLLNWLQPGLQIRTNEVSHVMGDGRHTTTHLELVSLDGGGLVGDIPGVKEFKYWGIASEDIPELFREFAPYLGTCQFSDCSHVHEPKCAIKDAVSTDDISRLRYDSYLRMRESP